MSSAVISLDSISTPERPKPPRIVVHGVHGVGKTTLAASAPAPVFVRTEDGLGKLRTPAFPIAKDFQDVMAALKALNDKHKYKTVVVDSLDWLEPLIWQSVAFENGKQGIEDFGYGKGYVYADALWKEFLNQLTYLRDQRGLTIVCIAHTEIKRFDAPDTAPYDRYVLKMHKRASALVDEWADIIGFARYETVTEKSDVGFNKTVTRGIGTGARLLALEERPAYDAKNRYGLPPEIALSWSALRAALKEAFAVDSTVPASPITGNGTPAPVEGATTEEPVNV
jgi:hypothetical protein